MNFKGILKGLSTVASRAWGILRIARPIIEALRPAVRELDDVMVKIDAAIAQGGVAADDFIDRNRDAILATRQAFIEMTRIGAAGQAATETLLAAGDDDTVDAVEVRKLGVDMKQLHDVIRAAVPNIDAAAEQLKTVN